MAKRMKRRERQAKATLYAGAVLDRLAKGYDFKEIIEEFGVPRHFGGKKMDAGDLYNWAMKTYMNTEERQAGLAQVEAELKLIGFANSTDYMEWDELGIRIIPKKDLEEDQLAAIQELTSRTTTNTDAEGNETINTDVKIKLHNKMEALKVLKSLYEDDKISIELSGPDGGPIVQTDMSNLELARLIAFHLSQNEHEQGDKE